MCFIDAVLLNHVFSSYMRQLLKVSDSYMGAEPPHNLFDSGRMSPKHIKNLLCEVY